MNKAKNLVIKNTPLSLLVSSVLLCLLSFFIWQRQHASISIEKKESEVSAAIAETNASVANISPIDTIDPGRSSKLGKVIQDISVAIEEIKFDARPKPSIWESIAHPKSSRNLSMTIENAEAQYRPTSTQLSLLLQDILTLQKFIEYNPDQDFVYLGADIDDDTTRIALAIQGVSLTKTALSDSSNYAKQLDMALGAIEDFSQTKDLPTLTRIIRSTQMEILMSLQASLENAQQSASETYGALLYQ